MYYCYYLVTFPIVTQWQPAALLKVPLVLPDRRLNLRIRAEPITSDGSRELPDRFHDESHPQDKQYDERSEHLPYDLPYMPEDIQQMAERELGETEERKQAALKKFRNLIAAEKKLYVRTDDLCLLAYLGGKKYDVDRGLRKYEEY
ncbi:hypothetical protein CEXT_206651 [Caerostris extrusa]|uniref:Uncharacterized protein n=1 Tax=Caerostris extrusa TaxID=172846 RepID=A0AAV4MVF5_CAEEX|nr:hypothetical protein CEXT_206651 [Caerostris extrusa]